MIRVRSHHGAPCCGVQPGAEGEVDEGNRGVAAALAGGLLVRVAEALAEKAPVADAPELDRWRDAVARLEDRNDALRVQLLESKERIAALEAENAQLKLDLDGLLNAPAKAEGDVTEKTGRSTRKG